MVFFQTVLLAMAKIAALGSIGYIFAKVKILNQKVNRALATIIIYITLPLLIFSEILRKFDFKQYSLWWIYPLISIAITLFGFVVAKAFLGFRKEKQSQAQRRQFVSLVTFQNSGYLPLILVATLFSSEVAGELFVLIFLFLIGFNLIVWSYGTRYLIGGKLRDLRISSLFSPPVIATVISLVGVSFGCKQYVSDIVIDIAHTVGSWTLFLAMIAIGANLAQVSLQNIDKKAIVSVCTLKLIILPLCALLLLTLVRVPQLLGFLILIELAVPSATSLSLIARHHDIEDVYVSHGVFFTHVGSIITIPIFLMLFQFLTFFK